VVPILAEATHPIKNLKPQFQEVMHAFSAEDQSLADSQRESLDSQSHMQVKRLVRHLLGGVSFSRLLLGGFKVVCKYEINLVTLRISGFMQVDLVELGLGGPGAK